MDKIQGELGTRAVGRSVIAEVGGNVLKESSASYSTLFEAKKGALRPGNSYFLEINDEYTYDSLVRPKSRTLLSFIIAAIVAGIKQQSHLPFLKDFVF